MKKIYLILVIIVSVMMSSCNPQDEDNGNFDGYVNGHAYVDLGLPSGLKWSVCNVGASKFEEYGDYFAYGEICSKPEYIPENSIIYGEQMGNFSSNPKYDVASAKWGGCWRMPSYEEMEELFYCCEWVWMQKNGVEGVNLIGPNGKSIFLPAAGCRHGSSLIFAGSYGYYWSSIPYVYLDYNAYNLYFNKDDRYIDNNNRYIGFSVRPVIE